MSIMDLLRGPDINAGVEEFRKTPNAILIDVRRPEEYADGRIPGSVNGPLQAPDKLAELIGHKDRPVFVYCLSGARSRRAANYLTKLGFTNVRDLGGINNWKGKKEWDE